MPAPARTRTVVVRVPGSKSIAIRALVLGARARGTTTIEGAPGSGDVLAVAGAVRALGFGVAGTPGRGPLRVRGGGGSFPGGARRLDLGGSATGLRLLTGLAALRPALTVLDGDRSLRRRAVGPLAAPLARFGAAVETRGGRPPVRVRGPALPPRAPRAPVAVDAGGSSQVLSAVLVAGAAFPGVRIRETGRPVSRPYAALTLRMLREFGARIRAGPRGCAFLGGALRGRRVAVEADWSSAAFPLAAAAILGRRVRVPGLRARSAQADRAVLRLLRRAGARCGADRRGAWCEGTGRLRPFRADLRDAPDLAPVAAALALFAPGTSRVSGAGHLRAKESDRIASCVAAVRALGGRAEARRDGFVVRGGAPRAGGVDPRGDHRVALAFLVAAAAIPGARVRGLRCVAKSWPGAARALAPLLRAGPGGHVESGGGGRGSG